MVLPAGFDIGLGLATSGITLLLEARLRLGQTNPDTQNAIDPASPPLGSLGYRMQAIEFRAAPDLGPAECWLIMDVSGPDPALGEINIGLTLALTTDTAARTTLGLVFREARVGGQIWERMSLAALIDGIEASPLLDVTGFLTAASSALNITLPPTTALSTGLLTGDGNDAEPAIAVFVSIGGLAAFPTGAASFVHPRRHIAMALGGPFVQSAVIPAAIATGLGPLPVEVQPDIELRELTVMVEPNQLRLEGSAAHVADPGVGAVVFGGPVRMWFSQTGQRLTVDVDDIDATMPISWLLLLLGPLGVFLFSSIDTTIDASIRAAVRGTTGGLLGGFSPDSLAPAGDPPARAVLRWVAIEGGSLVIGLSLHAGPRTTRVVGASGDRRVLRVQLDDDDVLSVPDTVMLMDADVLQLPDVHVVRSKATGRSWLRANPDEMEGNNLRSLPQVDPTLIPPAEQPPGA